MPSQELSVRVLRSGAWVGGLRLATHGMDFVRILILARLLTPYDFGLFGMASIVISWMSLLEIGAESALIQHRKTSRALYDTAWTLGILRRFGIVVALMMLAPLIGRLFEAPEAVTLLRVMLLVPLLQSLRNIGMVDFVRDLRQGPETLLQIVGLIVELTVAIGLALWLGNAWALVGAEIAQQLVLSGLSYVQHPYRPTLRLHRAEVRVLVRFGRWVVGSSVINWLITDGVQAGVARLLGVEALGHYRVARRVAGGFVDHIGRTTSQVTLAAFATLQDHPTRLRRAYLRVFATVVLVSVPAALVLATYGAELVHLLLGPRWQPGGGLVRILAVWALLTNLTRNTSAFFRGTGRPERATLAGLVQLGIVAILVVPLARSLGTAGVALAVTAAAVAGTATTLGLAWRSLGIRLHEGARLIWVPLLATVPCVILRAVLPGWHAATAPGLLAAFGALALLFGLGILLFAWAGVYPLRLAIPPPILNWLSTHVPRLRVGRWNGGDADA